MSAHETRVDAHAEVAGARVRSLLDVGLDGASFAAERASDGALVEVWRLQAGARSDALARRLGALASVPRPGLLPLAQLDLEREPPFLVVGATPLRWAQAGAWATDATGLRRQLATLADGLAAAHRVSVVHGQLGPCCVASTAEGDLLLDLTGLRVRTPRPAPLAPELASSAPSAASDVWALAALALQGSAAASDPGLAALLSRMQDPDPEARPSAAAVAQALYSGATVEETQLAPTSDASAPPPPPVDEGDFFGIPKRLGAFRLLEPIGSGGMGRVFRAQDLGGGPEVALKVLLPAWAKDPDLVARFRREARILARLESEHVTRFVTASEDRGFHYLVMELARGQTVSSLLAERKRLDLELALAIGADLTRALAEVHALALVHRDVKPANILVELGGPTPIAKLCDFGIARPEHVTDAADGLTREGTPGTPSFMAPEQVEGRPVDARTDVYAAGATLYALLAGRPPFLGAAHFVMVSHVTEPPPPLRSLEPSVPPPIEAVVMRCLAKSGEDRFSDAGALNAALAEAWRGATATASSLPQIMGAEGVPRVYDFHLRLGASPDELWPHVSNTERLNRAAGLDDVEWSHAPGEGYVRTEGKFRAAGMELRWRENPFEWVAPRRLGVLREYVSGPFEWLRSTVELEPRADGGTDLRHRIEIRPRGLLGRAAATVEVGLRLRRGLERVYRHIDTACLSARDAASQSLSAPPPDPFEDPVRPQDSLRSRIDAIVGRAIAAGADPLVAAALADHVATAPGPKLARIRPRVFARERGFSEDAALDAFLLTAKEGLLEILWDILCPSCRIPSGIEDSLRALREHGRCEACDLDFELDMARSVELVFRAHPSVREADVGVYCIGGPAHSPHVLAQVRLAPGERFALEVALEEGRYAITGRGLPRRWPFSVDARAAFRRWDLALRAGAPASVSRSLSPGRQTIVLSNDLEHEVVARLERAGERDDAITAADAASSARFRALFPEQVLAPDRLVAISDVALLFATIPAALARYETDEAAVHRELLALATRVEDAAHLEGGAVVKLHGDGVMAVFSDRVAALRAAFSVAGTEASASLALHAGPARMTTIGARLDYFGRTLHYGEHMGRWAPAGELWVSEPLLTDPRLAPLFGDAAHTASYVRVGSLLVARLAAGKAPAKAID